MEDSTAASRFALGDLAATPGALDSLTALGITPQQFIARHACGDWGDVSDADKQLNDDAIKDGDRLVSAYALASGERLLIITEADRSRTTVLLASEY